MNPSKSGLSTAGKTGIVVIVILVVLGAAYFAPSLMTNKGTQSTSTQSGGSSSPGSGNQTFGLLTLFGHFSQMQIVVKSSVSEGGEPVVTQQSYAYQVLGRGTLNSTQYTKVEFSQPGPTDKVVAWFNPNGGIDRLDILGQSNYTGPGAALLSQVYTTAFGGIPLFTNNATLLSLLTKTSENTTSIGPTQLDVVTYHLAVPTHPYKSIVAEYATIPGTNQRFVVYVDERMTDGTETVLQVTSITQ